MIDLIRMHVYDLSVDAPNHKHNVKRESYAEKKAKTFGVVMLTIMFDRVHWGGSKKRGGVSTYKEAALCF